MASIFGFELGFELPKFGLGMQNITYYLTIFLALIIVLVAGGIFIWWWYNKKVFNRKIVKFENVAGGGYQPTAYDVARIIKVGDGGEEVLYLKKHKVFRTAYGRKMGVNTYWFAVGQDGYWYNILLGDLDAKMGLLDIEPIDRDMRYMHVAIRKNIQDRYQKKKIEKIVAWGVGGAIAIAVIFVIGGWFIAGKMVTASQITADNINAIKPLGDALKVVATNLDKICSGAGISPA